jgi:hypothetical protein
VEKPPGNYEEEEEEEEEEKYDRDEKHKRRL